MTADDREDLLFLYAAEALEGEERAEVEAWLAAGGTTARTALAKAEEEVARLAVLLPPVAPDPAIGERLRRRIRAPRARRRAWVPSARAALAAGLAALLAAGVGYGAGRLLAQRRAEVRIASLRSELADARAERDQLDDVLADQEAAFRQLQSEQVLAHKAIDTLSAEHAEQLDLRGTGARPGARARVFWNWDTWYCYLRAEGLSPDPGHLYALWLFTKDGDVVGVGTFGADARGQATLVAPVPHDLGKVVRAGISVEPDERLGPGPRGPVVLLGSSSSS